MYKMKGWDKYIRTRNTTENYGHRHSGIKVWERLLKSLHNASQKSKYLDQNSSVRELSNLSTQSVKTDCIHAKTAFLVHTMWIHTRLYLSFLINARLLNCQLHLLLLLTHPPILVTASGCSLLLLPSQVSLNHPFLSHCYCLWTLLTHPFLPLPLES